MVQGKHRRGTEGFSGLQKRVSFRWNTREALGARPRGLAAFKQFASPELQVSPALEDFPRQESFKRKEEGGWGRGPGK